ncbi:hypothetical protein M422DRAFT_252392 [Sphaerobolus stellatus SS14]|uniref:Fanconi-associated nuclease n=1 Tax=Sphaerobolus stellatus (strain SS14) TaxID=990650 RepID=A0A0C9VBQ1_SPHS4|nr:hypothetical protein M422DRAFT_252392 [Sphaerobolus stellatus SS14]
MPHLSPDHMPPGFNESHEATTVDEKQAEDRTESFYVEVFRNILRTVMQHERFLFSVEEQVCLDKLFQLSYEAQYLFIRLCLRKREKWHSLPSLVQSYATDLGSKDQIMKVIDELCGGVNPQVNVTIKEESGPETIDFTLGSDDSRRPEVIDLTLDSDDEGVPVSKQRPISETMFDSVGETITVLPAILFAEDDSSASLADLLTCLTSDELKSLGKDLRVKPAKTVRSLFILHL